MKTFNVKDYCKNVEVELAAWKAKIYDVYRGIEELPTGDKQRMQPHIEGINIVLTELEDRVDQLRTECPTEWSPERKEIRVKLDTLGEKYNDTAGVLYDYDFGG